MTEETAIDREEEKRAEHMLELAAVLEAVFEARASGGVVVRPSPPPESIARALVVAQAAISAVGKDGVNKHHKYRYASAESIILEARQALNSAGLALIVEAARPVTAEGRYPYRLEVAFVLVHKDGASWRPEPMSAPVLPGNGRPEDKAEAIARTSVLSYFLRDLLQIPRMDEPQMDQRDDTEPEPVERPKWAADAMAQALALRHGAEAGELDHDAIAERMRELGPVLRQLSNDDRATVREDLIAAAEIVGPEGEEPREVMLRWFASGKKVSR